MKATCIINLGTCLSGIEPTKFIIDNLVVHGCNKWSWGYILNSEQPVPIVSHCGCETKALVEYDFSIIFYTK